MYWELGARLERALELSSRELERDVALRVEDTASSDTFRVSGRGILHLSILVETMRREGFELCVGRPRVIYKEENGQTLEPIEHLFVDCDEDFMGVVTEKLSIRKGKMTNLVKAVMDEVRENAPPGRVARIARSYRRTPEYCKKGYMCYFREN